MLRHYAVYQTPDGQIIRELSERSSIEAERLKPENAMSYYMYDIRIHANKIVGKYPINRSKLARLVPDESDE